MRQLLWLTSTYQPIEIQQQQVLAIVTNTPLTKFTIHVNLFSIATTKSIPHDSVMPRSDTNSGKFSSTQSRYNSSLHVGNVS